MFQSRLLKITVNHLQFQNKLCLSSNFLQCQQIRRKKLIYPMNKGQIRVLMDIFDLRYRLAYGISREHANLRTLDQTLLYKSAALLNEIGITKEQLREHPQLLALAPGTIENRYMLLQEAGFTSISPQHLHNFATMLRKPVKLFKLHKYIPDDIEIPKHFFTHLEDPPPPLEIPDSDDSNLLTVYLAALFHYLHWRLDMSKEELERLLIIYPSLKRRSFRLMESSLNIIEKQLGFTKDKIRRHGFLIHSQPKNILDTLERIKTLGGMNIKTVLQKNPRIMMTSTDTILKTDQYLQDFGMPDEAIQRCPDIYTLSSETVKQRLQCLESVPQFIGYIKNPSVVRLVHYQRKVFSRLNHLERNKIRYMNLYILHASQPIFDKFINCGSDRSYGNDVILFLSNELGYDKHKIRSMLQRHPFWYNIPLMTVVDTFNFLRNRGFTKEEIMMNIQIVVYSSKLIKSQLEELPYHPDLLKEHLRQKELGNDDEIEYSGEQELALCLYFIERDHHFSGDGIWFENPHVSITEDVSV